ncbi:MAG: alpha/beta hydrolase [Verrucomicrobiota bacterium]
MKISSWVAMGLALLAVSAAAVAAEPKYRVLTDQTFLAPERKEKLDLYLPEPPAEGKLSPALVWIHGGGWRGGTKNEARAKNVCGTLAAAGYVAVSIDYVLGDGAWPTNLQDCKNAVRFLRANAAKYRLDPNRIAVAGGSAGGHLALMVALTTGRKGLEPEDVYPGVSSSVRCVANFYGVTNLLTRKRTTTGGVTDPTATQKLAASSLTLFGAKSEEDEVFRLASPVTHVRKDSVPMLTLHGKADTTVDYHQAEELDRVAKERGARHEMILLEKVGHTFDLQTWAKKPLPRDLRPVLLEFLAQNMK